MNETRQLMYRHSSVRRYTEQQIDNSLLRDIVQCGQSASSSSFIQAYSVIRVSDKQNREIISQAAGNQSWVLECAEFLVICADMLRIEYCCKKSEENELQGQAEHFIAATVDAALMAQNMLLAAESAGLGGVFIGGIRNQPEAVAKCLQLPNQVYPVFGLCLGWPVAKQAVKPRFPVDVILHQQTYQADRVKDQLDIYDKQMTDYYSTRQSNVKMTNWSKQTAAAVQGKKREHMLDFLRSQGFLKR